MLIPHVVQTEADRVFVNVLNVTASATVDGQALVWDTSTADGVRVTQPTTATLGLFVGLSSGVIAASGYGLAQAYGYKAVAYVSTDTVTGTAGDGYIPTNAADYLTQVAPGGNSAWTAAQNAFVFGAAATTTTATTQNIAVFIRAL